MRHRRVAVLPHPLQRLLERRCRRIQCNLTIEQTRCVQAFEEGAGEVNSVRIRFDLGTADPEQIDALLKGMGR